ncbi:MAG: SWIM zinc finger family protein [Ardenticatenaceae bacterium]|nr:SWIM zinc finger family protein [Ardenticatenaceae bacterium]
MAVPLPLTEDQVRALAPADIFARGRDYWRSGAVVAPEQQGPALRALVGGSRAEPYEVSIEFDPAGRPSYTCDCPDFQGLPRRRKRPCKHVVAVMLQWAHAPETFVAQPPVEALLAGEERDALLDEIKAMLRREPALAEVLAQPPERRLRRRVAIDLAQVDRQINFALSRHRDEPEILYDRLVAILEQGGALIQSGDATNAVRLLTHLLARLLPLLDEDDIDARRLEALVRRTLEALELAALEAEWPAAGEQQVWLQQLMAWWAEERRGLSEPLMDLILHAYRLEDAVLVETWLRELLRKPRHASQQSERWWRERVLQFLLAFYEATGRHQAFLDLCWEEDEDARAALKFAELGQVEEARRLATHGLGSAAFHQALSEQLWQRGQVALALEVAELGLRYQDAWRPALLAWLAGRFLALGEAQPALRVALAAWRLAPSLERYRILRAAGALNDAWSDLRREAQAVLERQREIGLLVEVLLDEDEPQAAAAFLPAVEPAARREALTVCVADALLEAGEAAEAIPLFFDAADLLVAGRTRAHYVRAARLLARARRVAERAGLALLFEDHLHALLTSYSRRRALLEELARALE